MTVEFISLINVWESSELHPRPGGAPDAKYIKKYARSLEDGGFDYTLVAYHSGGYDPFTVSATIAACTDRIKPIVALRPNTMYPTVAAQSLATLDHLSGGRAVVHIISGGSDAEQARQGDYVAKDDRYARSEEYVQLIVGPGTRPSRGTTTAGSTGSRTSWRDTGRSTGRSRCPSAARATRRTGLAARSATSSASGASRSRRPVSRWTGSPSRPGWRGGPTCRAPG